jgi:hypothetical protein
LLLLIQPSPWRTGLNALLAAIPVFPLIIIAIATAGGILTTTGRLMPGCPKPVRAAHLAATIATLCPISDLAMITMFTASGTPIRPLARRLPPVRPASSSDG